MLLDISWWIRQFLSPGEFSGPSYGRFTFWGGGECSAKTYIPKLENVQNRIFMQNHYQNRIPDHTRSHVKLRCLALPCNTTSDRSTPRLIASFMLTGHWLSLGDGGSCLLLQSAAKTVRKSKAVPCAGTTSNYNATFKLRDDGASLDAAG